MCNVRLDAAWIIAMAACTGCGVHCFWPPSSPVLPHFYRGLLFLLLQVQKLNCNLGCWHYTFAKFGYSHSSSFIPFPRCALSLLSLALLTWLLCDNSCWKAFNGARAIRFPSQLSPCPNAPSMALLPGRGWCLPWGLSTKHPGKADFYNSLNSQRVGLPSIYFSFYPASKGSPICRQYLALPDKLHLYRLIQTQAINTRRLCTDCRHTLSVPLPGPTFLQAFRRIPPGILMLPRGCAVTRLNWDEAWRMWLDLCECWPLSLSILYLASLSAVI